MKNESVVITVQVSMTIIWLAAMVVLALLEAATTQLVTIWFALGSLVALIASLLHAPVWLQILLFVVVSAVTLVLTRPLVRKITSNKQVHTNADRVIGKEGVVLEDIRASEAAGLVKVDGAVWSARSADDSVIPAGSQVSVERIEGVKLIVSVK